MKTYDIQTTIKVTSEEIDDLLAAAFEGGSNFWCKQIRFAEDSTLQDADLFKSEVLTRGGVLELYDAEEDNWHRLTLQDVLEAVGKECVDFEDYDAAIADNVIQRAVFGEVIYA